ncbi:hypothetical protein [Jiella avicenniae]|uniref:Uncharacterized protein n=1 Tax=Jiella avicenniae TaxID=2907202 RepID=A0A9X1NZ60_9HYPH|nr:hypothetical protein [Jiella avicenniae]MCE7026406.1 hypothetical protein [Jiella avicenniae]
MADRLHLERLSKRLTAEGQLIEAGWIGLRLAAIPHDAPPIQLTEMRNAFFAGAHHLLASIMTILDPGEEPTAADLERLSQIRRELDAFIADYAAKAMPTDGSA